MSAEATGLQIPIGMSLEEAQLALKQLEQMARETGKKVKAGFGPATEAAEGFSDSISKWRKEEKGEGRQVGFLVDQFTAGLVPATGAAREGINLLTKSLIGGFGLGLALDAAGAGARLLVEWWEKEEKAEADAKKTAEEHAKVLRDLGSETQSFVRGVYGSTAALEFLYSKQREFNEKTFADRKRADEIELQLFTDEINGATSSNALLEERAKIVDRLKVAEGEWNAARGSFRQRQEAEEIAAREKKNDEITKAIREARNAAEDKQFEERYQMRLDRAQAYIEADNAQFERYYGYRIGAEQAAVAAENAIFEQRYQLLLDKEKAYNDADDAEFISHYEMRLAREQAYIEIENRAFEQAYNERLAMEQAVRQTGIDAFRTFSTSAVSALMQVTTRSAAYERAMKAAGNTTRVSADLSAAAFAKMAQDAIAATAAKAAVEAIFWGATALARLSMGDVAGATLAGSAAAEYGIVAAAAGAGAYAIGQSRGTTRAERESVSAWQASQANSSTPSGAREVGGSGGGIAEVRTREVVIYGGDLFTPQELAQAHARREALAKELNLLRAS